MRLAEPMPATTPYCTLLGKVFGGAHGATKAWVMPSDRCVLPAARYAGPLQPSCLATYSRGVAARQRRNRCIPGRRSGLQEMGGFEPCKDSTTKAAACVTDFVLWEWDAAIGY